MMKRLTLILFLSLFANSVWAATWYVRPASGEYGAEDGTSYATAYDGFADITWGVGGVVAGDTLRVSADDGLYYERMVIGASGSAGSLITITGWSNALSAAAYATVETSVDISGDQSFSAATTYAASGYAWTSVGGGIYKKTTSALPQLVTSNGVYLTPVLGHGKTEAEIIAALTQAGTFAIQTGTPNVLYVRLDSAPANSAVRMNDHRNDASAGAVYCSGRDYLDLNYITTRMVYVSGVGTQQNAGLTLEDCENVTVDYWDSNTNLAGIGIDGGVNVRIGENVSGSNNMAVGLALEATPVALAGATISGTYNYNNRAPAVATNAQTVGDVFDGDGIGIGQSGGTFTGIVIDGVTARYNGAVDGSTDQGGTGIYVGSASAMSAAVSIYRSFIDNNHGCGIHLGDEWTGGTIAGNIITNNVRGQTSGTCLFNFWADFTNASWAGGTIVNNIIALNNGSRAISFNNATGANTLTFKNNVFAGNVSGFGSGTKLADVVIGTAANDNVLESNNDVYSTSVAAFYRGSAYTCAQVAAGTWGSVSANTGESTVCLDPRFLGGDTPTTAEGFRPLSSSHLLGAGSPLGAKYDYEGYRFGNPPNIGAFVNNGPNSYSRRSNYDRRTTFPERY